MWVVYHLCRKIGSSTICANVKEKRLMASSVRLAIYHLLKKLQFNKSLTDHNSKMAAKKFHNKDNRYYFFLKHLSGPES